MIGSFLLGADPSREIGLSKYPLQAETNQANFQSLLAQLTGRAPRSEVSTAGAIPTRKPREPPFT